MKKWNPEPREVVELVSVSCHIQGEKRVNATYCETTVEKVYIEILDQLDSIPNALPTEKPKAMRVQIRQRFAYSDKIWGKEQKSFTIYGKSLLDMKYLLDRL